MENRIVCEKCDGDEFHVLCVGEDEFVQFKCLECEFITKADTPDNPIKKFAIDRCFDIEKMSN